MNKLQSIFLFSILLIGCSITTQAQNSEKQQLELAIKKQFRYPMDLSLKKVTSLFAIRIFLSTDNKVDSIQTSKHTPEKMIKQLTNTTYLSDINWENIIRHKIQSGESVIIPLAAYYDSGENVQLFYEYTLDDLYNFNGRNDIISNCTIVPTITVPYRVYH
ncbi:hypothetical protein [Chitinophaga nivalis]|uniref:Lipoprotein n=1 Tax=Chitinophaga nivalis TaxID=2991709 RepID=A0ABT3IUX3_9BACT|nr:hypothetical protein [Chitinophaga nivalis]MCW3462507.1 hypothetical protein [Chitinophaga nivalis]MCW3487802.1 hypothetical protein [Chitinophaga nivalis]